MMDLRAEILREHSKAQCSKIVKWVGKDQKRFDSLFQLFLHDEYRVQQRAAGPVSYAVADHPELIKKNWKKLVSKLKEPGIHDSVKRNGIRFLQHIEIPEKFHGEIMDICFNFLGSPNEALAIKVFSMSVLANLAKLYPDIIPELRLLIEDQFSGQTAGFKSRGKKILSALAMILSD